MGGGYAVRLKGWLGPSNGDFTLKGTSTAAVFEGIKIGPPSYRVSLAKTIPKDPNPLPCCLSSPGVVVYGMAAAHCEEEPQKKSKRCLSIVRSRCRLFNYYWYGWVFISPQIHSVSAFVGFKAKSYQ